MKTTLFFIMSIFLSITIYAEDNIQDFSYGKVNWTKKVITVTGSGAPTLHSQNPAKARLNAERAAKMDAYRNVLEVVKGLKIKSTLTIEQQMDADKIIATHVQGIIQGGVVKGTKYYDDGGVDIILEVPLSGILPIEKMLKKNNEPLKSSGDTKYNALIIDLSNLKYTKSLLPEVRNESGQLLYSVESVKKEIAEKNGIINYVKSLDDAKQIAGDTSLLILQAKALDKTDGTTVIISDTDASKLTTNTDISFLTEGKVYFIVK